MLSIGKLRGLQRIANPEGILAMCAMDHRGSMRSMIDTEHPREVTYKMIVERKLELCSSLARYASAILLDPIFGAAQCISSGVLPSDTGLLVSIEATGYCGSKENRISRLLDGWNVEKIKRMGASAVKILVYYRPDLTELAKQQLMTIRKVADDCIKFDIPFLVEPVSYAVGSEVDNPQQFANIKEHLVIDTARDMTALPIDILKAEFPADIRYKNDKSELIELCQRLDMTSRIPWVILSAGVDFEMFYRQVEIACRAGASGFLGGRAIWQEAMRIDERSRRMKYLSTIGADRLKMLVEITNKYGVPWYKKIGQSVNKLASVSEGWYQQY